MTPTTPGFYFFQREPGLRQLVLVCKTKGPKGDGSGPLFAETFVPSRFSNAYFYRPVSDLVGDWDGPLEVGHDGKPVDKTAAAIIDVCVEAGTAHKR